MLTRRDFLFATAGILVSSAAMAAPPKPKPKPPQPKPPRPKPKRPARKPPPEIAPDAGPDRVQPSAFTPTVPVFHRFSIGSRPVTVLHDGAVWQADVTKGFVRNAAAADILATLRASDIPGPGMHIPYNPTLVETSAGPVLIDTGFGPDGMATGTGQMAAAMKAAGIEMTDVRTVLLSHFHAGHIGGLVGPEGPLFPNAEIKVPLAEWAYWTDPSNAARAPKDRQAAFANVRRQLGPYASRVEQFVPGSAVVPGISAIGTSGHTPGHTSFLVMDGADQAVILGDVVPTPALFLPHPEWAQATDMDPTMAVATRMALLDRMASDGIQVVGYHFPMPGVGRIEKSGAGYRLAQTA